MAQRIARKGELSDSKERWDEVVLWKTGG